MKITTLKIRLDNSDGTFTEATQTMPHKVAETILCDVIDWENRWTADFQTARKFIEATRQPEKNKETPL